MQRSHELAGGSAPHLDIRAINGWSEGYGPMDRQSRPATIGPVRLTKPRVSSLLAAAKSAPRGQDIVIAASSSSRRPPPPPPGAAKLRRTEQAVSAPLFPEGNPYAQALMEFQKAPLAADAALVGRDRERSPPRGDRRPLSTRNRSREQRAAAGGADETYGQIRQKALSARSKTLPAEICIGETPKRSRAVPPNQDALMRRAARTAAVKRGASGPAEDDRVRPRGGAANVERATRRQRLSRLYADRQVTKTVAKKSRPSRPRSAARPALDRRTDTACASAPREPRACVPLGRENARGSLLERRKTFVRRYQRHRWTSLSQQTTTRT